jgi:hypothetical protein
MAKPKYASKEYNQAMDRPPLDPVYAAGLLAREKKENFKIFATNKGGYIYYRDDFLKAAAQPASPPISATAAAMAPPPSEAIGQSTFQAPPQEKAKPARAGNKLDDSLLTSKKPSSDIDKAQRIGTPGETIPIVFGKRANSIGGVWIQPPLVKAGTKLFVGSFLYPVSQGEIVSAPVKYRAWVGLRSIAFLADQTITLQHDYATSASLAAAPSVCPIGGSTLFCGVETFSYLEQVFKAEVGFVFTNSFAVDAGVYSGLRIITRGTGDTSNTVFTYTADDIQVFNSDSGADVTAAWLTFSGITSPASVTFAENFNSATGGGRTVGTILDTIAVVGYIELGAGGIAAALGIPAGAKPIFQNTVAVVDTQYNPLLPASTGTLLGTQYEIVQTPYADPASTPSANNSAYADITFLRIEGDIYDPPSEGSFPTTTKQIFIYYEQGVKVDLYSGGLVGGVYPRGASNQLVDLVMYLFTIYKQANGAATADIASPIFIGNLTSIAAFCSQYNLFFNGVLDETVNIIDIAATLVPYFLLSFLSLGGQYRFEPLLPLTGNSIKLTALTPAATFTEDEILPGSFSKSFRAVSDRQDFIAVMLYREANPSEIGIQRTKQVAYTTTALDAPVEQFDMTDFCTSADHAAIYAKYELSKRKLSTHSISFQTALITTGLKPTDVIKIQRQRITSRGDNRTEIEWYQITGISYGTDGGSTIEAEHFPVSGSDIAEISNSIVNGSFRVL